MNKHQRTNMALGVILILAGLAFLSLRFIPGLYLSEAALWPLIVMGSGLALFIIGVFVEAPDMAVPACIVAGVGGILYWQNLTGDWASWSYMWTLFPGFAGVGIIIAGLMAGRGSHAFWSGLNALATSLILFLIFGSFFGAFVSLGTYWPLLLVAVGVILLLRSIFDRHDHYSVN
jgi:hypothetical protein